MILNEIIAPGNLFFFTFIPLYFAIHFLLSKPLNNRNGRFLVLQYLTASPNPVCVLGRSRHAAKHFSFCPPICQALRTETEALQAMAVWRNHPLLPQAPHPVITLITRSHVCVVFRFRVVLPELGPRLGDESVPYRNRLSEERLGSDRTAVHSVSRPRMVREGNRYVTASDEFDEEELFFDVHLYARFYSLLRTRKRPIYVCVLSLHAPIGAENQTVFDTSKTMIF